MLSSGSGLVRSSTVATVLERILGMFDILNVLTFLP